jgi:hypothetical protein
MSGEQARVGCLEQVAQPAAERLGVFGGPHRGVARRG